MTDQIEIAKLLQGGHIRRIAARSRLVDANVPNDHVGYLSRGILTVLVESSDGQEMVVDYLYPGEFFGESALFENKPAGVTIIAREACEVILFSRARFRSHCLEHPEALLHVTAQLSRRLRKVSRKAARSTFIDVTSRIAYALLDLARKPDARRAPQGMQVKITKQELGRLVGCSREMASRAVKELEQRELVSCDGRNIVLRSGFTPSLDVDDSLMNPDDSLVVFPLKTDL